MARPYGLENPEARTALLVGVPGSPPPGFRPGDSLRFAGLWRFDEVESFKEIVNWGQALGPLGLPTETLEAIDPPLDRVAGESLETWRAEAGEAWRCVQSLRVLDRLTPDHFDPVFRGRVSAQTRRRLRDAARALKELLPPFNRVRQEYVDLLISSSPTAGVRRLVGEALWRQADDYLCETLHRKLKGNGVTLLFTPSYKKTRSPLADLHASTYLGHIWKELAKFHMSAAHIRVCASCLRPMVIRGQYGQVGGEDGGHDHAEAWSFRRGTRFCSKACQMRWNRAMKPEVYRRKKARKQTGEDIR